MSERSLARFVQKHTDFKYQAAVNLIRKLKPEVEELMEKTGWGRRRAYEHVVIDYWEAKRAGRYTEERECDNCWAPFFVSLDKKGTPDTDSEYCPECRTGTTECARCGNEMIEDPRFRDEGQFCEDCNDWIGSL